MTPIASASPSPHALAAHDDATDDTGTPAAEATAPSEQAAGAHPLAAFGTNQLHPLVQQFAAFTPEHANTWLAPYGPPPETPGAGAPRNTGIPLYDTQGPGGAPGPQLAASAKPGKPMDLQQLEALNKIAQKFDIGRSPVSSDPMRADDLRAAKHHFQAATDALKAGDYKKAEQALRQLGFPLPSRESPGVGMLSAELTAAGILLGAIQVQDKGKGRFSLGDIKWGARGNQAFNDLNGFAANATMINRLASTPGGVSNPPTEAQVMQHMRDLVQPAKGSKPPTAQDIMKAASEITSGMIMHYSSAGRPNPEYGTNPRSHAYYKDTTGQFRAFDSMDAARKAASAGKPPMEAGGKITQVKEAHAPDEWSDIASPGKRAGRYVGDCESKVYLQTRLLTEAGFTSLGTVDVQHEKNGHMFGVFKAPDGTLWVTSNEEFKQVKASDAKQGVTQADLDATLKDMTADLYHVQPNFKGDIDLSDFKFSAGATAQLSGGNAPVDSIRRSGELNAVGGSDTLIPQPAPKATGSAPPKP